MIKVHSKTQIIDFNSKSLPCRIGRDGFIPQAKGREGDWKTPLGTYQLRYGLYRADRLPGPPPSPLSFWPIQNNDGWCDDSNDAAYNRLIRLPYPASHEVMTKESGVYDIVIVLGHNDNPPKPNKGSAIFLHITHPDMRPTAGCVAIEPEVMVTLLPHLNPGGHIEIKA